MLSRSLDFSTSEEDSSYLEPGTSFFSVITIKVSVKKKMVYAVKIIRVNNQKQNIFVVSWQYYVNSYFLKVYLF